MTIKNPLLPSRISRPLIYLLCLLTALPAGMAFGQNKTIAHGASPAGVGVSVETSDDFQSLIQETTAGENAGLPIVFVPGTAGSELRLTSADQTCANWTYADDLYWLGLSTLKKRCILAAPLDENGDDIKGNKVSAVNALTAFSVPFAGWFKRVLQDHLGYAPSSYDVDVYADFLSWAYNTFGRDRFYIAAYDWRKGATAESAASIQRAVDQALSKSRQTKVILLAHSLGGFVSRDYIVRTEGKQVAALIAVGTPWLGAPKAARALLWGYNFDIGLVKHSDRKKKIKGIPEDFTTEVCKNSKCQDLTRLSFFKRESLRELAKNFPGVYLQLPTSDFMEKYGSYYGEPRSVIWGMDKEAVERFYEKSNPKLYGKAKLWRADNLKREDYGVRNYLVAGVYNPACKEKATDELKDTCEVGNRMDMQMPQEDQVPRASLFRRLVVSALDALASLAKSDAYDDSFVALDSDYEWGDGTSPLLSATAGEYIRGGNHPCRRGIPSKSAVVEPCEAGKAKNFLGEQTKTFTLKLGARYGHSAMLNDPQIKYLLMDIYRQENSKFGLDWNVTVLDEDVNLVSIVLSAEDNRIKNEMITSFVRGEEKVKLLEPQKTHFLHGRTVTIVFQNPRILDSEILAPKDRDAKGRVIISPRRVYRNLRMSDLKNMSVALARRNQSSRDLVITGVKFIINGKPYLADESRFPLVVSTREQTVPIPKL